MNIGISLVEQSSEGGETLLVGDGLQLAYAPVTPSSSGQVRVCRCIEVVIHIVHVQGEQGEREEGNQANLQDLMVQLKNI